MAEPCCNLVGNLSLSLQGCIISVNMNSRTEVIKECAGTALIGPTVGSVSVTGYASSSIHVGCPGRASVSLNWMRRYDCDTNVVFMIPAGKGSAFVAGDIENLASLIISTGRRYPSISASSSSGPHSVYMTTYQEDGYGLVYRGDPISFNSDTDNVFSNFGIGSGPMYLQSFNLEMNPGELPVASYSFVFTIV
jgi:hypothetical protein